MLFDSLNFWPWIGPRFEDSVFGVKILIVGECPYLITKRGRKSGAQGEYNSQWFSENAIRPYQLGTLASAYHTKWISALVGYNVNAENGKRAKNLRNVALDSVAFYNYFDIILPDPRTPIPEQAKEDAPLKFRVVMEALQPKLIIVLSRLVAEAVRETFNLASCHSKLQRLGQGRDDKLFVFLPHPSAPQWWQESPCAYDTMRDALEKVGGGRPILWNYCGVFL